MTKSLEDQFQVVLRERVQVVYSAMSVGEAFVVFDRSSGPDMEMLAERMLYVLQDDQLNIRIHPTITDTCAAPWGDDVIHWFHGDASQGSQ